MSNFYQIYLLFCWKVCCLLVILKFRQYWCFGMIQSRRESLKIRESSIIFQLMLRSHSQVFFHPLYREPKEYSIICLCAFAIFKWLVTIISFYLVLEIEGWGGHWSSLSPLAFFFLWYLWVTVRCMVLDSCNCRNYYLLTNSSFIYSAWVFEIAATTTWTMFCCGGKEEENHGPPANQYTAPPRGGDSYGGDNNLQLFWNLMLSCYSSILFNYEKIF